VRMSVPLGCAPDAEPVRGRDRETGSVGGDKWGRFYSYTSNRLPAL